jgi:sugar phosphate permease
VCKALSLLLLLFLQAAGTAGPLEAVQGSAGAPTQQAVSIYAVSSRCGSTSIYSNSTQHGAYVVSEQALCKAVMVHQHNKQRACMHMCAVTGIGSSSTYSTYSNSPQHGAYVVSMSAVQGSAGAPPHQAASMHAHVRCQRQHQQHQQQLQQQRTV